MGIKSGILLYKYIVYKIFLFYFIFKLLSDKINNIKFYYPHSIFCIKK